MINPILKNSLWMSTDRMFSGVTESQCGSPHTRFVPGVLFPLRVRSPFTFITLNVDRPINVSYHAASCSAHPRQIRPLSEGCSFVRIVGSPQSAQGSDGSTRAFEGSSICTGLIVNRSSSGFSRMSQLRLKWRS